MWPTDGVSKLLILSGLRHHHDGTAGTDLTSNHLTNHHCA